MINSWCYRLLVACTCIALIAILCASVTVYNFSHGNKNMYTIGRFKALRNVTSQQLPMTSGTASQRDSPLKRDDQVQLNWTEVPVAADFKWTSVDSKNNTRFYSAYLDERNTKNHLVLVLGLHNHSLAKQEFYCAFQQPDKTNVCLEEPAKQEYLNKGDEKPGYDSWAFSLLCGVPVHHSPPTHVLISLDKNCSSPHSSWIPVSTHRGAKETAMFGVCIETSLFGRIAVSNLIEGIERNIALGAQWLTVYVQQITPSVRKALRDYEREGVLEVVEWRLSQRDAANSHYYAESVITTDCLYRNMYKVKYLMFTDVDEIVVPQKHGNWSEMIRAIDQKNVSTFLFSHTAFVRTKKQSTQLDTFLANWTCNGTDKDRIAKQPLPLYILHNYRSPPYPYFKEQMTTRRKVMVKPEYVRTMGIHDSHYLLNHTHHELVSSDVGLLYHYRVPPLCQKCEKVLTRDDRIQQLSPDLFTHILNKICHYL